MDSQELRSKLTDLKNRLDDLKLNGLKLMKNSDLMPSIRIITRTGMVKFRIVSKIKQENNY